MVMATLTVMKTDTAMDILTTMVTVTDILTDTIGIVGGKSRSHDFQGWG